MTGMFSLTTLRACVAGAKELGLPMHVTVKVPGPVGPDLPPLFTGVVVGMGSKLGVQAGHGLVEDIPPDWVTFVDVAPTTLKLDKATDAPPAPSPITVEYLQQRYNHGYATAIGCAAELYRTLVEAECGNGDPFWTTKAETDVRQRQQLEGMVTVAVAILKALPHQQMRPHTALQTVKDHIRDLAREESN